MEKVERLGTLLNKARESRRPLGLLCTLPHPEIPEVSGKFGFDWLLINQEHTQIQGPRAIAEMLRGAELNRLPTFVKLNRHDPIEARDSLDQGAYGVMVPFTNSAEQLKAFNEMCRFPPVGRRGICPVARASGYALSNHSPGGMTEYMEYVEFQNLHALVIPTIESQEAVENLDEILAAAGDMCPIISVGPIDLAMSFQESAKVEFDAERRKLTVRVFVAVIKKIHAAGKLAMMPIDGPWAALSRETCAEIIEAEGIDLPYTVDTYCLGYGLAEAIAIRDATQNVREERARKAK